MFLFFDVFLMFVFVISKFYTFIRYIAEFTIKLDHFLSTGLWLYIFFTKMYFCRFYHFHEIAPIPACDNWLTGAGRQGANASEKQEVTTGLHGLVNSFWWQWFDLIIYQYWEPKSCDINLITSNIFAKPICSLGCMCHCESSDFFL